MSYETTIHDNGTVTVDGTLYSLHLPEKLYTSIHTIGKDGHNGVLSQAFHLLMSATNTIECHNSDDVTSIITLLNYIPEGAPNTVVLDIPRDTLLSVLLQVTDEITHAPVTIVPHNNDRFLAIISHIKPLNA